MLKVNILATCSHCNGEAYLPMGEAEDSHGNKYIRHIPCPFCEGSGNEPKWVNMLDFATLMRQAICPHKRTSFNGNIRFSAGDVLDDIQERCDDCGAILEGQTLDDYLKDEN